MVPADGDGGGATSKSNRDRNRQPATARNGNGNGNRNCFTQRRRDTEVRVAILDCVIALIVLETQLLLEAPPGSSGKGMLARAWCAHLMSVPL